MVKVFVHGVPDTPFMWTPLLKALDLREDEVRTPALPGFVDPPPQGFAATKEAYCDWLIGELEDAAATSGGPVDLVGHDWGALLSVRAARLRPELVRTWAVSNAVPDPDYRWHRMARLWQTPVVGELLMAISPASRLGPALAAQGMPAAVAEHEAGAWSAHMRACILKLYRSAKTAAVDWSEGLEALPKRGLVIWGDQDPYVPMTTATAFCARTGAPLEVIKGANHWALIERPDEAAVLLRDHWAKATADTGG